MPNVQWPRRVRGNEFEQDFRVLSLRLRTVSLARLQYRPQLGVKRLRAQVKIDEAGPGNLDLLNLVAARQRVEQTCSDIARALFQRLREPHCNIAGKVAVGGVARALDG